MSKNVLANNALLQAIQQEDVEQVRRALTDGADPNVELLSQYGGPLADADQPAIILAAWKGSIPIVTLLLDAGANVNANCTQWHTYPSSDDPTPFSIGSTLCYAISASRRDMVDLLLQKGADVNEGQAILYAVQVKELSIIKKLHQAGADLNVTCGDLHSALFYAVKSRDMDIFQWLYEHGARFERDYDVQDAKKIANKRRKGRFCAWFKGKDSRQLLHRLMSFWEILNPDQNIEALLLDIIEVLYSERLSMGKILEEDERGANPILINQNDCKQRSLESWENENPIARW